MNHPPTPSAAAAAIGPFALTEATGRPDAASMIVPFAGCGRFAVAAFAV
jgi:hypothetical protein